MSVFQTTFSVSLHVSGRAGSSGTSPAFGSRNLAHSPCPWASGAPVSNSSTHPTMAITRRFIGQSWSTPFIWENEIRTEIVTAATGAVRSYDLDGNLLWEIHGMSGLTAPTPFAKHGLVYISSGYPGGGLRPVYAVRAEASGDISLWAEELARRGIAQRFPGEKSSSEHIAWSYPLLGTYSTSALVYGGYYYTLLDRGFLLCHDARTGDEIYSRQRSRSGTVSRRRRGGTTARSFC